MLRSGKNDNGHIRLFILTNLRCHQKPSIVFRITSKIRDDQVVACKRFNERLVGRPANLTFDSTSIKKFYEHRNSNTVIINPQNSFSIKVIAVERGSKPPPAQLWIRRERLDEIATEQFQVFCLPSLVGLFNWPSTLARLEDCSSSRTRLISSLARESISVSRVLAFSRNSLCVR